MVQQVVEEVGSGSSDWVDGGVSVGGGGGDDGDGVSGQWQGSHDGRSP